MTNEASSLKPYKDAKDGKKEQVADMFNNISKTYDFLNHFLSLGIDIIWRKKAINALKSIAPQYMLDVATGTGDFALESIKILNPKKIIGVDISQGMLDVAQQKIKQKGLSEQFEVQLGDSEQLQFDDNTFDAVTVAFGVRNFENLNQGLADICRVLKPGGKAIILEFSNPKKFPIKQLYNFYFKRITPTIGKLFSKDSSAYSYLPESVARFPDGEKFAEITKAVGFSNTIIRPQTFGVCTIYIATK
ncbi:MULTISPECIES: bifunctional demethylmenaquinone methyltransferase/2-methoxy-6-polyprenyl-1,4-benzoquinol methylase UbiE [Sphingobacterium]|jgi:demethylmenaquinone methyltransferase/2-methoxy-6-polyprenyl-1,4-benzoquinol methylase|uniref:Demethylmenaquinone methyltransferase n=1 Tax=Sphingobacterium anhuiense TaxID=493780 RepID=A0ABW5YQQ1_9SPHI|nr:MULTISPECIES: bifunctional demethylmenaquinone methyltransferase/2-methoxy-6-polyprenyl-1,4-benzoquinol methylase UbiE [Sphingobacterium]MBB2951843.1 demethylmenaquinone methyltransferase/2-methoxy-6-polyprenyl-1,4-benzoquinol methylase [Sphingobacterium sp. JUb56]MCW2260373.1 demethylmenaquinone methyltransferase/2-methoxy-6-polyprenyl-1,4-benzoquinol methylase [Sphingobacterium kitahiroshimense]NJI71743.1 bifunctional demethylmenaquinone methyltransferase/2-methoxy-6-polyprenyl-1,4-benzoqui